MTTPLGVGSLEEVGLELVEYLGRVFAVVVIIIQPKENQDFLKASLVF